MIVVTIGSDRQLFTPNSAVRARIQKQAMLFDQLHVVVFSLHSLGLQEVHEGNLHIYPTNSASRLLYVFDAARITKRITQADVITTQDPFEAGLAGWLAARYLRVPLQLQVHTDLFSPYFVRLSLLNRVRTWLASFLLPRASGVRAVSKRIKKSIEERKLSTRVSVLPIYTELTSAQQPFLQQKYPQFEKIVLVVSRLEKEKNVSGAIKVFAEVHQKLPGAGLVVVGDGSQRALLMAQARSLGLEASVVFEGKQPGQAYYPEADALLNASWYEGYGLVIVEALAAGCPVVSTDVGVAREAGASVEGLPLLGEMLIDVLENNKRGVLGTPLLTEQEYLSQYKQLLEQCYNNG